MENKNKSGRVSPVPLFEIVIPTYNRPGCIKYILSLAEGYFARGYDFSLSIYDSSTDDGTAEAVADAGSERIKYVRMDSSVHVDEKTLIALKEAVSPYVMLCGDGCFPKIDRYFEKFFPTADGKEVTIIYETAWKRQRKFASRLKKFYYEDKNGFFAEHFWHATFYGGTVCRREVFARMDVEETLKEFGGTNFIYPCTLAKYSEGPYGVLAGEYTDDVPYKNGSGWLNGKEAIKIWTEHYYNAVCKLKGTLSDEAVEEIVKNTGRNNWFLTSYGLMSFRCTGNYSYKIYRQYKFYIKKCKACSTFAAVAIALTPRWIFLAMRSVGRLFKMTGRNPAAHKESETPNGAEK